jgi:hypothetical protein
MTRFTDDAIARNAATIQRLRDEDRARRIIERARHCCPVDAYTSYLCPADTCERCGWSPLVPVPDIEATARGLVNIYGADAVWFVMALGNVIEEELRGHRR